jgi:glycine betaine/proline transport system substrate-binding protein
MALILDLFEPLPKYLPFYTWWTGSHITSTIVAKLLGKIGDNVQIVPLDGAAVFPVLENGDLQAATEIWTSSLSTAVAAALATGKVIKLGDTGLIGMDRWWYPNYVKAKCPRLPDWHALNACAKLFATLQTGDKGQLLLYPASWRWPMTTNVLNPSA